YLYLNFRDEFYRINIDRIAYFEADGNYTNIVLTNKQKGVVGMNLAQMQKLLSESLKADANRFARVGKRFIVNLNYVYHIEVLKQRLTITDGGAAAFSLPVSKDALKKLKEMYISPLAAKSAE
ncbi:MAG: LytTR family transcriptional regulator, partial [Muribaculaceae bacterium]|nr:LytTR family transcriptional regulator [Muribaculaceae bacterium]